MSVKSVVTLRHPPIGAPLLAVRLVAIPLKIRIGDFAPEKED
jgi:hypothetical protein